MSLLMRNALALLGLMIVAGGCSRAEETQPVANVAFSASRQQVVLGSPVDLTYKFEVLPNAAIDGDYAVFVHVLDKDGGILWTDDHEPPVKTSAWKGGLTIGPYTRTRFVPRTAYTGPASIVLGLYKPGGDQRLTLASALTDRSLNKRREYKVGEIEILPGSDDLRFGSGWYDLDGDPKNPGGRWRWTQKSAVLTVRNPNRDATLHLEIDARTDAFTTPQVVTIVVNGQTVATFPAANAQPEIHSIPLTSAQLGSNAIVEIRIEVDRTFVPSQLPVRSLDTRELGLRVYNVFVEPK
jgi:hypothetical protein